MRVLCSIAEVTPQQWDALLVPDDRPFSSHAHLLALESSGVASPDSAWSPRHLVLEEGGALVAAAPAYVKRSGSGEFLFDGAWARAAERMGVPYFPKLVLGVPFSSVPGRRVLVAPGHDVAARTRQLLAQGAQWARANGCSSVHVHFGDDQAWPTLEALGYAQRLSMQYVWRNGGYRDFADFLERFTARRRKQLKREARAVAEAGFTVKTLRGPEVDPALAHRLHAATVERYHHGPKALPLAYFEALVRAFPDEVEFVEARRHGQIWAGALNLACAGALYGRYWGALGPAPFLHFAVCLYHPVAECIERGLTLYHPGAGGEHKLTRGFTPTLVSSGHLFFEPRLDRTVREFLAHERAALEQGLPLWQHETGFKASPKGQAHRHGAKPRSG